MTLGTVVVLVALAVGLSILFFGRDSIYEEIGTPGNRNRKSFPFENNKSTKEKEDKK